jgi:hypothetical protein
MENAAMIKRLIERLEWATRFEDEQGAAFVELALCLPMLFVLMFGVIEFSQLILDNQIMTGLSRQGSNIASREPNMKLQTIVSALGTQGASLNIGTRGRIIITEVDGTSTKPVIESQAISTTGIPATSVTESWISNPRRNIPLNAKTLLNAGQPIFVTEIFYSYVPITPVGGFLKMKLASTLYDVAYF